MHYTNILMSSAVWNELGVTERAPPNACGNNF